jgi:hypothetical protein
MFKIFKKKLPVSNLEKAKELGLITEEEFLRLKADRAKNELENFVKHNSKKK